MDEEIKLPEMMRDLDNLESCFYEIFDNVFEDDLNIDLDRQEFVDFMKKNCVLYADLKQDIKDIIGE